MPELEEPRDQTPRGFGPTMRADDGTEYQATEEDVRNALPYTAAFIIAMTAWDFSSHAEWTMGADHFYFTRSFRMLVRTAGLATAGFIVFVAWRDAVADERREAQERAMLAKREFVVGKPPRWDE